MNFTLTVPNTLNYTPRDLMLKFANNDFGNGIANRYICTYNQYFTTVLYDQKTEKTYKYDHWQIISKTPTHTTIKVFLKEI